MSIEYQTDNVCRQLLFSRRLSHCRTTATVCTSASRIIPCTADAASRLVSNAVADESVSKHATPPDYSSGNDDDDDDDHHNSSSSSSSSNNNKYFGCA